MNHLRNAIFFCLLIQISSCTKQEVAAPLLSPELSDFTITSKRMGEEPFTLVNPKSKSDGAFTFKVSDNALATVNGNVVTVKNYGTCTITAIQAASGGYKQDSIQTVLSIGDLLDAGMSGLNFPATKKLGDVPFEIIPPTSNSKAPIVFTSSNPAVASISGTTVTIKSVGRTTLTASQVQNGIYKESKLAADLVVIAPPVAENSVTDIDGNVYKTVKIGTQTWMAENLKTTRYKDGTTIPAVTDASVWSSTTSGAWCNYNNSSANETIYGKLYNWYAVNTAKLAPEGWHVPSDAEWTTLYNYIGGTRYDGGKIQQQGTTYWFADTGATNVTEFTGLPGGTRNESGVFSSITADGIWWTTTFNGNLSVCYDLYVKGYLERMEKSKTNGFSVRCIKN